MHQAHRLRCVAPPQDAIVLHRTGKVLFGKKISETYIKTKRYLRIAIDKDSREITFEFHSRPKHDRQQLYNAPGGKKFCFIGREIARGFCRTQDTIPWSDIKIGPRATYSLSLIALLADSSPENTTN